MKNENNNKEKKKLSGFKKFLIIYPAVFIVVAAVLLIMLNGLLKDYEASEPNNVMAEFTENFKADGIGGLLRDAETNLTEFETIDILIAYFEEKIADKDISYKRKSGEFTSAKPVYSIMAGDEAIAKITLEEKGKNGHNFVEWKIGNIAFEDAKDEAKEITIKAPAGAKVSINGVEVSESYKSGEDVVVEATKNVGELTDMAYETTYVISGLIKEPEITAQLNGVQLAVTKEEAGYNVSFPADDTLLAEQKEYITNIFEHYGKYIINRGNLSKLLSYTKGTAYTYLSDIPAVWAYLYGKTYTYEFRNESVTNLVKYSDECFSVEVYFDLFVDWQTGNTTYNTSMTYIFVSEDGTWYLADFIQHKVENDEDAENAE